MSENLLDRETVLDLSVNIIPLVIIFIFFVLYVLVDPYAWEPFIVAVSLVLLIVPFAILALVTYSAGRAIEQDERKQRV
jgi:Ca2+/Na+ antiporter